MTPASERTVFVVDDDAAALDSLVLLLRSDGLNPSGFSSAHAFLDALSPNARGCASPAPAPRPARGVRRGGGGGPGGGRPPSPPPPEADRLHPAGHRHHR